jgi:hypothetical protein
MRAALLAAVLLLAACTGASPVPSGDPVRILATDLSLFDEPFTVAVVETEADYLTAWGRTDRSSAPPDVDWSLEVAVYLGMAGSSSCPETFERLVVDEDAAHVYGEWSNPASRGGNVACTDDLQAQGILLAVSRDVLPAGEFLLTLRAEVCTECPDTPDQELVTVR